MVAEVARAVYCDRINPTLPDIMPDTQKDFIPGHKIKKKIILNYDIMQRSKSTCPQAMLLRPEVGKNFDRIQRIILEEVLSKWRFGHAFIQFVT